MWACKPTGEQLLGEQVRQQLERLVLKAGDASDGRLEVLALKLGVLAPEQVQEHSVSPSAWPVARHTVLPLFSL
jgi:hypothetical protein